MTRGWGSCLSLSSSNKHSLLPIIPRALVKRSTRMLSKSKMRRTERAWRYAVFGSMTSKLFVLSGFVVFAGGALTPMPWRIFVFERVFGSWFALGLLLASSSSLLTFLKLVQERDWVGSFWLIAWTLFLSIIGGGVLIGTVIR